MTNLFDLTGRTAVVTGSAQGVGRAMAIALAEAGADLILLDRNEAGNEAAAHSIRQLGRKALPIAGDVTDCDHIDRVFATVDREFGRVDILGNVAGEARVGAAEEMALTDIRTTFHNLVISRYYTCQLAGRRMLAQGKGSIMSIGSIAGVSSLGRAQSVYGMAMAAVIQMTRELSNEWAGRSVRAGELHPAARRCQCLVRRETTPPSASSRHQSEFPWGDQRAVRRGSLIRLLLVALPTPCRRGSALNPDPATSAASAWVG